jgi:uncharacterized protein
VKRGENQVSPRDGFPERTCTGCGAKRTKTQLQRLCLSSEGSCLWDKTRTGTGRGAYLCGAGCLRAAVQRKALARAFRGRMRALDVSALEAALAAVS